MLTRRFEIDGETYKLVHQEDRAPYEWQVDAFKKLVPLDYAAIFAEVGCGKSAELMYLVTAHYLRKEINAMVLVAPKSVYRQWATQQLPEHMCIPYETYVWGQVSTAKDIKGLEAFDKLQTDALKILLVNVEAFSYDTYLTYFKSFLFHHNTAYVVDEATRIKTPDARRTQNIVMKMNTCLMWRGKINSVVTAAKKRYILTGTPVDGSPMSVYSMFNFLQWGFFSCNYSIFKQTYALMRKEQSPGGKSYMRNLAPKDMVRLRSEAARGVPLATLSTIFNTTETDIQYVLSNPTLSLPWKNLAQLKRLITPYSFTIKLEECFLDAPEEILETIEVELTTEQKKAYTMLKKLLFTEFDGKELTVTNKLTLSMRLQQVTGGFLPLMDRLVNTEEHVTQAIPGGNPKYKAMIEDMEEYSDRPIIIFCRYVAEAEYVSTQLAKDFDTEVGLIIGRVSQTEREDILQRFDKREIDFLVATPGCLSVGRNLQISHVIYFFSLSFSSEEHLQAKGRIRRANQKFACIYKYITAVNTIDKHVVDVLKDKQDLLLYMQNHDISELI